MGKEVNIEAFVVESIADIPNTHIVVVKEQYLYLTHLYFSDISEVKDTLEVDCLNGSDLLVFSKLQDLEIQGSL